MNSFQQNAASKFKKKFNTDIEISSCLSKSLQAVQSNSQKNSKEFKQERQRKPIKKSILKKIKQIGKNIKYLTECENSSQQQSELSIIQKRKKKMFKKKHNRYVISIMQSQKKPQPSQQSLKRDSSFDLKFEKQVMKQGLQELKLSSKNSQNNDLLKQIQENFDSCQGNFYKEHQKQDQQML